VRDFPTLMMVCVPLGCDSFTDRRLWVVLRAFWSSLWECGVDCWGMT
jgi:hypothetical protein